MITLEWAKESFGNGRGVTTLPNFVSVIGFVGDVEKLPSRTIKHHPKLISVLGIFFSFSLPFSLVMNYLFKV